MLAADCSVNDTLTPILKRRSRVQMGQREEPDGDQARKDSSGEGWVIGGPASWIRVCTGGDRLKQVR